MKPMKLRVYGAGGEVGKSCFILRSRRDKIMLDAGIKMKGARSIIPGLKRQELGGIIVLFLTHAHLDHSGAIPFFVRMGLKCQIIATRETKLFCELLFKDLKKISGEKFDLKKVMRFMKVVKYGKGSVRGVKFELISSGHIPGSYSVVLGSGNEKVLYTGDINASATRLTPACKPMPKVKALIMEGTYVQRRHENRAKVERNFREILKFHIDLNGKILIPAFGVARMQEVLLALLDMNLGIPIFCDGMGAKVTRKLARLNGHLFPRLEEKVTFVTSQRQREEILALGGSVVILTTSGMLNGGPVLWYLPRLNSNPNVVILTGFQVPGTNGHELLTRNKVLVDGRSVDIGIKCHQFPLSDHADTDELTEIVRCTNPRSVVLQHGDRQRLEEFSQNNIFSGREVHIPVENQTITL